MFFYCTAFHFKKPTFVSMQHSASPEKSHFIKSLTKADPWELSPFSPVRYTNTWMPWINLITLAHRHCPTDFFFLSEDLVCRIINLWKDAFWYHLLNHSSKHHEIHPALSLCCDKSRRSSEAVWKHQTESLICNEFVWEPTLAADFVQKPLSAAYFRIRVK